MTTALDVIVDGLEMIGVLSPGDVVSDADASRSLGVLNDMIDSWSNENLTCYAVLEQSGFFVPGVSQYPIGPGAAPPGFDMTRPLRINDDYGSCYLLDGSNNKYYMNIVDLSSWNMRTTSRVTSNVPDLIYYDPQYPIGIINIWPVPTIGYQFFWDSYQQLTNFASLLTAFSFPPGYKLAVTSNFALEIFPYFRDGEPSAMVMRKAVESKGNVKRKNLRRQIAIFDAEIVARGGPTYNIFKDSPTR